MKQSFARIIASLVIVVFVNFMFSNAVFTHVHKGLDGRPVTHSHPYLPNSGHSHTAQSLDLVFSFNAAVAQPVAAEVVEAPDFICIPIDEDFKSRVICLSVDRESLRGPPDVYFRC